MQHLLGHAAEQVLGDTGPAISTDNDEIRRDLLRSRENDARDMGFIELQQPVRLPSPSSPIPRRHDRSAPPPAMFVVSRPAFSATSPASRGPAPRGPGFERPGLLSRPAPDGTPFEQDGRHRGPGCPMLNAGSPMEHATVAHRARSIARRNWPEGIGSRRRRRADCRRSGSSRPDQLTRCRSRGRCGAHTLEDRGARSGEERTPTRVWPILGRLQFRGGED